MLGPWAARIITNEVLGEPGHGRSSVGLVLGTGAATQLPLPVSYQPLFSGLVSAPGAIPSFFMPLNITATMIMIN